MGRKPVNRYAMMKSMYKFSEKRPILFEIILIIIALIAAGVISIMIGGGSDVSISISRIIVAMILFIVFFKCFRKNKFLNGFIIMMPALLFALYKIPYHYVSGAGAANAVSMEIILIGLAPAVFEEIIFRGILIYNLKKKYSDPVTIVLISAIIFSLVHLTNLLGMDMMSVVLQVMFAFSVGAVLSAVYLKTENILSIIIAHAAIDIVSGIFPGGTTTPYYFIVIFAVLLIAESAYGFVLARKMR